MRDVFGVFWQAAKDFWEELFMLALMNLVTVLLLVPVVTFPPAIAGLWNAANLAAQGRSISWSDYFEAFKKYFWKAWGLALMNLVIIGTLVINLRFYAPGVAPFEINENLSFLIRAFWLSLTIVWVVLQMYPLALLLEQSDQRLRVALRNGFVLLFAHPGFSLVLLILILIVSAVSTLIPALWALVSLAFLGVVCNKAVRHLLVPYREQAEKEQQEQLGEALESEGTGEDVSEADMGESVAGSESA
jgi:uncharacterized membrane protein YesL